MNQILFNITAGTHVGCVRTNNEDNFVLNTDLTQGNWFLPEDASKPIQLGGYGCLMVVADGMGGTNCGEVASAIAVNEVQRTFSEVDLESVCQSDLLIEELLCSSVTKADAAIKKESAENPSTRGMGTTVVLAWVLQGNVHLAWCGDSRAYVFKAEHGLRQLSHDHSYVQSLVDQGLLSPTEAMFHPQSNIITRCLSDADHDGRPDYMLYTLEDDDIILLCTDGLSSYCTEDEMNAVIRQCEGDVISIRNSLIQAALDAGGFDNVTVAVLKAKINPE